MTKRLCTILFLVSFLGACATPAELRQNGPALQIKSQSQARDVAACIADKWENTGLLGTTPVQMKIIKGGHSVAISNEGHTGLLADIKDAADGGSVTALYKYSSLSIRAYDEAVIFCQRD